jgi:hypothetical protein
MLVLPKGAGIRAVLARRLGAISAAVLTFASFGCSSTAATGTVHDGGETCDQLAAEYKAAVTVALACTPGAPDQCQVLAAAFPTVCPSLLPCAEREVVNDGTNVEMLRLRWIFACDQPHSCGATACPDMGSVCVPTGAAGASTGTCVWSAATDGGN